MSLRARKSIKIMPGVRLNISKFGVSTSIGGKGATLNLKPGRKPRATVGIPGTGLRYTTTRSTDKEESRHTALQAPPRRGLSPREMRFGALLLLVLLGCAIATDSWGFAAFVTICGIALFLAFRQSKD